MEKCKRGCGQGPDTTQGDKMKDNRLTDRVTKGVIINNLLRIVIHVDAITPQIFINEDNPYDVGAYIGEEYMLGR